MKPDVGLYGPISINVSTLLGNISVWRSDWKLPAIEALRHDMHHALQCQVDQGIGPQDVVQVALESALAMQAVHRQTRLPLITVDAGAHMFSVMAFWPCDQPLDVLISNGLATMAYALPAAIAAAVKTPDRMVMAFTGDGGLLMCLGELSTAVEQAVPIIVIVFNDQSLSLIDIKQQASGLPSRGMRWETPNFSQVMEGLGGQGYQVKPGYLLSSRLSQAGRSVVMPLIPNFAKRLASADEFTVHVNNSNPAALSLSRNALSRSPL